MLCKCSGKYIDIYFILKITFLCSHSYKKGGVGGGGDFFMNGNRTGTLCPFLSLYPLRKGKKKVMKSNKANC